MDQNILDRIPQRPPFLFLDKMIEQVENSIVCEKLLTGEEDFFKGHFPGNPIMPGVLQQETIFQAGALLMSYLVQDASDDAVGVITRVENVKFRQFIKPNDLMRVEVSLTEKFSNIFKMKGKILVNEKVTTLVDFTGAMVKRESFS